MNNFNNSNTFNNSNNDELEDLCINMNEIKILDIEEKNKRIIHNDFNTIIYHYIFNGNDDFTLTCNYDSIFENEDYKSIMNYLNGDGYKYFYGLIQQFNILNNIKISEIDSMALYNKYVEIIDDGFTMI